MLDISALLGLHPAKAGDLGATVLCSTCGLCLSMSLKIYYIPVVPHKAVAEVSKIGNL